MAGSKTILSIEDDVFIREMYTRALRKAGYEVEEVGSGEEGIKKANENHYDLILVDIYIPGKTGLEVLSELKGADGAGKPGTKIVIMTNYSQDESSRKAVEAKADGYFIKADVTPKTLVQMVKQIIG